MMPWPALTDANRIWRHVALLALAVVVLAGGGAYLLTNQTGPAGLGLHITKLRSLVANVSPTGIAWSPDGNKIAAIHDFGRAISVWNASGYPIVSIKREVTTGPYIGSSLAFMPDNRTILAPAPTPTHYPTSSLGLWDAETGVLQRVVPPPAWGRIYQAIIANIFALSPDGTLVAFRPIDSREPVSIYRTSDWSLVKTKQIWTSETRGLVPFVKSDVPGITPPYEITPNDFPEIVNAVAFAPNNDLAVGAMDGLVIMGSDPASTFFRYFQSTFERDIRPICCVAYSPDGRFIATGVRIGLKLSASMSAAQLAYLQVRDVASGGLVVEDNTIGDVRRLAWDRNGQILAVVTNDDAVHLYRPFASGSAHQDLPVSKGAFTLSFSPTKSELAVSTETGLDFYSIR
jgi:WD domain, G-beta repeat/WD40-like Beta Propeller Repeat